MEQTVERHQMQVNAFQHTHDNNHLPSIAGWVLYHVMSRGNERGEIARDDLDRQRRLDWLQRTVEMYGWRLQAFVLKNYRPPTLAV
jgi:hypothetical protein